MVYNLGMVGCMVSDRLSLPPQQPENPNFSNRTYSPHNAIYSIYCSYNYNKMPALSSYEVIINYYAGDTA